MGSLNNKRAAIVKDGVVVNVVIVDPSNPFKPEGFEAVELEDDSPVGVMWIVDPDNPKNFVKCKEEEID